MAAKEPTPDWFLVDRYWAGAALKDLGALLIVNKSDLGTEALQTQLNEYRNLSLPCIEVSSTTGAGLKELSLICIPCPDQDAAVDFYVGKLGFEKRTDVPFGDKYRWVEVYPPSGTAGLALAPPREGETVSPKEIGLSITTADADATHRELRDLGVDVDEEVMRMGDPVPPMFWFRDPEGHSMLIVEQSA